MNEEQKERYEKLLFKPGHTACAGCPIPIIVRTVLNTLGKDTVVAFGTSCLEIISSQYPYNAWGVPAMHSAFENTAAIASGIEAAHKKLGKKVNVVAFAGDGGTFDIGLQALSGMVDRGHNVLYVVYDNESYANTGIQRSSATPFGAWTTTSPAGKKIHGNKTFKKPLALMMATQGAKYVATASISNLPDFKRKVKKASEIEGPKFIHVLNPCPTGWKFDSSLTVEIAKLSVETGLWVLFEIDHGKFKITYKPKEFKPVEEYLKLQRRFKHLTKEEIEKIQNRVKEDWSMYEGLEGVKI